MAHSLRFLPILLAMLATVLAMALLIPFLRRLGAGQTIREDGPIWHNAKGKTPTMGGLAFVLGISLAVLTLSPVLAPGDSRPILMLVCALSFGFIGFLDDYIKVVMRRNLGLTPRQKILLTLLASAAFLATGSLNGMPPNPVGVPVLGASLRLGVLAWPLLAFVLIGTVNGVNLTDGLDGLCASVTVPVAALFLVLAGVYQNPGLRVVAGALLGGLLGYLPFNLPLPKARVFMGDTGAFFLGGLVAALAFSAGLPLMLALCGVVYVLEALSDILQVAYFKHTGGKRLFRMAPLHHHFELLGMSEVRIGLLFTALSAAGCLVAYWAYLRFYPIA